MSRKKTNTGLRFQPAGGNRAAQVPVGKKQRLSIERVAGDGRGIAFIEGRTWFVSGALAGEDVEARVLAARGKVVEARLERVFQASPERREAPCRHYARCGGCNLQHLPHEGQLALKQRLLAEQLQRVAGVQPEEWAVPLSGPEFGYRRRARVAVRWDTKARQLDVGFRAEASQDIVGIDECAVLVQPLQSIMRHLPTVLRSLAKPQALGHVELFSGTAEAVLVRHVAPLSSEDLARLEAFCREAGAQLWLQGEGEPAPVDAAAQLGFALEPWGMELAWRPGDFVQVNAQVNTLMIQQALAWLAPEAHERVLDLFCGLGNFALPWPARRAKWWRWRACRPWSSAPPPTPTATMCITLGFFRPIYRSLWRAPDGSPRAFLRYSWIHRATGHSRWCKASPGSVRSGWSMYRATRPRWRETRRCWSGRGTG